MQEEEATHLVENTNPLTTEDEEPPTKEEIEIRRLFKNNKPPEKIEIMAEMKMSEDHVRNYRGLSECSL